MNKTTKYLIISLSLLLSIQCTQRPSDETIKHYLVGKWEFSNDTLAFEEIIRDNGTFHFTLTIQNNTPFSVDGIWQVKNGAVIRKWEKSNKKIEPDFISVDSVLVINKKERKIRNRFGTIEVCIRKK